MGETGADTIVPVWYITLKDLPPREVIAPGAEKVALYYKWEESYDYINTNTGDNIEAVTRNKK